MLSWASVVSGRRQVNTLNPESGSEIPALHNRWEVADDEVHWPFSDDGLCSGLPFRYGKKKRQQRRSKGKRSSIYKKKNNKGSNYLENYCRAEHEYEYQLGPWHGVSKDFSSRQSPLKRNYKQKYEKAMKDLDALGAEFENVVQEKGWILIEKRYVTDNLKHTKEKFEQAMKDLSIVKGKLEYTAQEKCRILKEKCQILKDLKKTEEMLGDQKHKCKQLEQLQKEFNNLKVELESVRKDNVRILNDNHKLSDELIKAEETLEHYKQQSDRFKTVQPQINQLKCELERCEHDNIKVSKDLMRTRKVLNDKDIAFTKFVEEFSSTNVLGSKDDANFGCFICKEICAVSGEHNTCFLDCGHFFGKSCITKWIKRKGVDCYKGKKIA